MTPIVLYALAAVLLVLTALAGPVRAWLAAQAKDCEKQSEYVDLYQAHAAKFLRLSDPKANAELREIVRWAGYRMIEGPYLLEGLVFSGEAAEPNSVQANAETDTDSTLAALSEEAIHAFSQAIGYALLVSASHAFVNRARYKSLLPWLIQIKNKEIKEPSQVVYRYRATTDAARKHFVHAT